MAGAGAGSANGRVLRSLLLLFYCYCWFGCRHVCGKPYHVLYLGSGRARVGPGEVVGWCGEGGGANYIGSGSAPGGAREIVGWCGDWGGANLCRPSSWRRRADSSIEGHSFLWRPHLLSMLRRAMLPFLAAGGGPA